MVFSTSTQSSVLARIVDHRTIDNNINIDSTGLDTTFNVVIAMILISTVTGNTILAALSAIFLIVVLRITTPEVTQPTTTNIEALLTLLTPKIAAPTDAAIIADNTTSSESLDTPTNVDATLTSTPSQDAHNDDEPSSLIVPADEKVRIYHHVRPTVDITEVVTPTKTSHGAATETIDHDDDSFGTLASDVFSFKTFEKYLKKDKMYLVHMPVPNPSITSSGAKASPIVETTKIFEAARPAPVTVHTPICKLSTIIEEDEEDIELPRSSGESNNSSFNDLEDNSFNSLADQEDFSDSEEEIIAFAKKIHRLCDELDKVERFSEPVEHTIALARDIEATFRQWDEEDLEAFSDSEGDVVALAKQIEVNTRPSPPDSP
ncbi:hypothetical protein N0V85_006498, partial [Neurospora sp. IMI 360204]